MLVSLVTADSYQISPLPGLDNTFSDFRGTVVTQVPVIRIFGSSVDGKKTCLHVHGAFPYMYIPRPFDRNVDSFPYELARALDSAINASLGLTNCHKQHVYKVQQVSGIPFYGYHQRENIFFKIYFYNPMMIKKAADLLQNGAVFAQNLQPYEAHIPFILQFMIDYNLYGMSFIHIDNVKNQRYSQLNIKDNIVNEPSFQSHHLQQNIPLLIKQTTCQVELDVHVSNIINRREITSGFDLNPGLAAIWNEEKIRRKCAGLDQPKSQFLYSQSSNRHSNPSTSDEYQKQRLFERLQTISNNINITFSQKSNTSCCPEVTNEDSILKSHTYDKTVCVNPTPISETSQLECHEKTITTASFDSNDRCLVDILEHLAEDNSDIDNDSVLGTHCLAYEGDIGNDIENDDAENLNITTSVLMNSWELDEKLTPKRNDFSSGTQTDLHDTCQNNAKNSDTSIIPQSDGASDKLFASDKSLMKIPVCGRQFISSTLPHLTSVHDKKCLLYGIGMNKTKFHIKKLLHAIKQELICKHSNLKPSLVKLYFLHIRKYVKLLINMYNKFCNEVIMDARHLPSRENTHNNILQYKKKCFCFIAYSDFSKFIGVILYTMNLTKLFIPKKFRIMYNNFLHMLNKQKKYDLKNMNLIKQKRIQFCCSNTKMIQSEDCMSIVSLVQISNRLFKSSKLNHTDFNRCATHRTEAKHLNRRNMHVESILENKHTALLKREMNVYSNTEHISPVLNKHIPTLVIPAFDGCTGTSDSEIEVNVDTTKQGSVCPSRQNAVKETELQNKMYDSDHKEAPAGDNYYRSKECRENRSKNIEIMQDHPVVNSISSWTNNKNVGNQSWENMNEPMSEENVICNTSFTQCILEKMHRNCLSFVNEYDSSTRKAPIKIVTKFKPPSCQNVYESMSAYNIPEHRYKKPFLYKKQEMTRYRKIIEKVCILNINLFKPSLECITCISAWRRMKVNEFHISGTNIKFAQMKQTLASCQTIKIVPLVQPPVLKDTTIQLQIKEPMLIQDFEKETRKDNSEENCNDKENVEFLNVNATSEQMMDSEKSIKTNESYHSFPQLTSEDLSVHKYSESLRPLGMSYGQIEISSKNISNCIAGDFLSDKTLSAHHYLTIISLEIHVTTRENLLPDPEIDAIGGIFYAVEDNVSMHAAVKEIKHGAIIVNNDIYNLKMKTLLSSNTSCPVLCVKDEEKLLQELATLIKECDPDILTGWQVETLSWGYIIQRAHYLKYNNFLMSISRLVNDASNKRNDYSSLKSDSDIKIPGRIILDTWRIMKHELTLLSYTFENVLFNVMHERTPCPDFKVLTTWWLHSNITKRCRVIDHYIKRVVGTLQIMSHLDIISRTSEHAKLFGILLYEVFSRGSQYRVESIMLRLAKPLNYIAISPSVQQRANMRAPAALPLIMEPQSMLYTDPLIVLDFQSLYPSIIIAYNYCFSTCLGRVEYIGQTDPFEFGAATLKVTQNTALKLQNKINFAPCGIAFVKPNVRRGILPRMLEEILNTRLMVKESIKVHCTNNRSLQRALDSQQLGLKLIANVTYGYTAANFSGRMPCVDVGDSIVSKGRETLERAINLVESTKKWGARVVYGDTDSLFILLPGKSRKQAFSIGAEIAEVVTAANPVPVKLKFEKVLHPCILQTKKRYCGYMYETPDQEKAVYMAKGIETVRRDGCPAVSKILEKTLRILFDSKDVALVKSYVTRQLDKIIRKRISIQDLIFAKEFRGISGYKANACVPALELTRRLMKKDPRAIPRQGQRVQYIIIAGAPDQPLIHCVRTPWEVMSDRCLTPNSVYYITKVIIPPLNRCLNLIGVDVNEWYREMSHCTVFNKAADAGSNDNKKTTIYQFFNNVTCIVCAEQTTKSICSDCLSHSRKSMVILQEKIRRLECSYYETSSVCLSCTGHMSDDFECASLDCPTLYRVKEAQKYLAGILDVKDAVNIIHETLICP